MKFIALCIVFFSLSAGAANSLDMGIVPASDSLQAKLGAMLQSLFDIEEAEQVEAASRLVKKTAAGGYSVEGSNGTLECQEYSPRPSGTDVSIQIQTYGCKVDLN